MITIQTERLTIRQFVESDLNDYYAIVGDPENAREAGFQYAHQKTDAAYLLRSAIKQGMVFAIVETLTQRVIGSIGLYPRIGKNGEQEADAAEIGYVLNREYWGQGYMTEAGQALITTVFKHQLLTTIWASILEDNQRSKRVLEKLGFQYVDQFTHSKHDFYQPGQTEMIYRIDRKG